MHRSLHRILQSSLLLAVILLITLYCWIVLPFSVQPEAEALLPVSIETKYALYFRPDLATDTGIGLILYPGARVDSEAYAPLCKGLSDMGITAAVVQMPLDLSVLAAERAAEVIEETDWVDTWFIGGHSLGGAMAAVYAAEHQDTITGLLLLGSYPPASVDLSESKMRVLSVIGSEDTIVDRKNYAGSRVSLPAETTYAEIDGANHAGFGWYGTQRGDGEASISRAEQLEELLHLIADHLL